MQKYKSVLSKLTLKCLHQVWAPAPLLQLSRRVILCNRDRFNSVAKALAYGFIKLYESLCSHHLCSILNCFGNHFSIHLYILPSVIAVIRVHSGVKIRLICVLLSHLQCLTRELSGRKK